jgi:hypothetical protein
MIKYYEPKLPVEDTKSYYQRLKTALERTWNIYLNIPACSREEVIELKILYDIIQKRLDIMLDNIYTNDGYKLKQKNKKII